MTTDKFILSTMLNLVYWDGDQAHVINTGKLGDGVAHYNGITWDEDGVMYVTGCNKFHYVLYKYQLPTFEFLGYVPGELHETHQIFYQDGKIYIANTGKNRVEVYHRGSWYSVAWRPSPHDIDHINALWSDKQYMYVAEHRQKVTGISIVRKCSLELEHIEDYEIGPNIHNIYRDGDLLYNLTSPHDDDPAGIVITDLQSGAQDRVNKPEWGRVLLRGLARTEDYWYVGMSRWEGNRAKREIGDALIIQLDNDFNETERILLEDYGPVCDIRVLNAPDKAHNGIVHHV